MNREEIRNKIFKHFQDQVSWIEANPNQIQHFQMGQILEIFPFNQDIPQWETRKTHSVVREIVQELINTGYIYPGTSGDQNSDLPWLTVTTYGIEAFKKEDWLPYDPEGYIRELKVKVPALDDITLAYIGESISAYNRRNLLSATLTIGVASENLMLLLIEAYITSIPDVSHKTQFSKKVNGRFISTQYKEFKKELLNDPKLLPKEFQDSEVYLDAVFNFIRLNRNDAGHPTGKKFDAKTVYANLQIFSDYANFIFGLIKYFKP